MNNPITAIARIVALLGGAAVGVLLARRLDDLLTSRAQERSEYHKERYGQGLAPVPAQTMPRTVLTPEDVRKNNPFLPWELDDTEREEGR